MTIAIVVPVLNRFDLFTEMMTTVDVEHRLYVMDSFRYNYGVSTAWNTGILRAVEDGYRYVLVCNDDIWFEPGAIQRMHDAIVESGAVLVSPNQRGEKPLVGIIPGADFFCFMIDAPALIERCGLFDTNFWPAYFEDNDMHYRMILLGETTLVDTEAIVHHHRSATQHADPNRPVTPPKFFEKNRGYYKMKWGGEPTKETFIHPYNDPSMSPKEYHIPEAKLVP